MNGVEMEPMDGKEREREVGEEEEEDEDGEMKMERRVEITGSWPSI